MACDRYIEWLSARLDGVLAEDEERALEEHLAVCPACRAAGAQLAALQSGFGGLDEFRAPEGFAQGVMDRIRAEEPKKVIPLFKRPRWKALAGLAACLALAVGLYGVSGPRNLDKTEKMDIAARSFSRDAVSEELEDTPQIAAYSDSDIPVGDAYGAQKSAPDPAADGLSGDWAYAEVTLILDRLPQGAEELLPPDAAVVYDEEAGGDVYTWLTTQELAAIEELAFEQGLIAGTTEIFPSPVGARCALIVRGE